MRPALLCVLLGALAAPSTGHGRMSVTLDQAGDAVQVRGTERLGWSQPAASSEELSGYRFLAFVDDVATPLEDVRCGSTRGVSGFECTAALPRMSAGRHVIELVAVAGTSDFASNRSGALLVDRMANNIAASSAAASGRAVTGTPTTSCVAVRGNTCLDLEVVAQRAHQPYALAPLPDGRLLFIERADRIVELNTGTASDAYQHQTRTTEHSRLVGLSVDPQFTENRFVYIAVLSEGTAQRELSVLRLREVGGRLAEPATVITELPIAAEGWPAMSMGPDRHLYIAVPASAAGAAGRSSPYDGRILRFTSDGAAAGDRATVSPIFSEGRARPAVLTWQDTSRLWLGASGEPLSSALWMFPGTPSSDTGAVAMKRMPMSVDSNRTDQGVEGLAFASEKAGQGSVVYMLAGRPRALHVAAVTQSRDTPITGLERLALDSWEPTAIAAGNGGELFVAGFRRSNDGWGEYAVLRLVATATGR